ncbi:MAG: DNA repair protein RadA [Bacteroidales bacterium]|nr:DNA repair protein RadA [Bacteroidales bacterium]HOY38895.1 DNA repair protein RadA [Bacteroidales bacterium]HQP04276.1 DNA repair protein RadA [Bacteroidales bacterium]
MPSYKSVFVCQQCAYKSAKWIGRCPSCNSWNSFIEETVVKKPENAAKNTSFSAAELQELSEVNPVLCERIVLPFGEFNRVLGGGLVKGSVILIGGEPGIGKSTLIMQSVLGLNNKKVLYVSGEESPSQIKLRADRLSQTGSQMYLFSGIALENILAAARTVKPDIVVIDSVQTIYSEDFMSVPGSVSQIRGCAQQLQQFAKSGGVPVILIGHINKEGNIAGPMTLEHIVDVVIQFEGDSNHYYRLLRSKKNRFGSAFELGVFEMTQVGLVEITDPGNMLLSENIQPVSGVSITAMNEGSRTIILEIQALAGNSVYSSPQRTATGFDSRRLNMLLAVIEKRLGYRLGQKDIFLNIAGGIRLNDPAADLAVISAILSSLTDLPISHDTCFIGEISLSGQVRPVSNIQMRLSEVSKLGFRKVFLSKYQQHLEQQQGVEYVKISSIKEFAGLLFAG